MKRSSNSCPRRWVDKGSDASPALQAVMRAASAEMGGDRTRLLRLQARMLPFLSGTLAENAAAARDAPAAAGSSAGGTASSVAAAHVGVGTLASLAKVVAVASLVAGVVAVHGDRPREQHAEGRASTPAAPKSTAPSNPRAAPPVRTDPVETAPTALPLAALPPAKDHVHSGPSSLTLEVRLLERARALIQRSPTEALALLRRHAERFPNSTLASERELFIRQALAEKARHHSE